MHRGRRIKDVRNDRRPLVPGPVTGYYYILGACRSCQTRDCATAVLYSRTGGTKHVDD